MLTDPPRHTHLRRAAARGFGPRVVANFEAWIREIVREAIDNVVDMPAFDYVNEFARTIPAYAIGCVLGVPRADGDLIVDWSTATFVANQDTGGLAEGEGATRKKLGVIAEVAEYSQQVHRLKREHPGDDMFTAVGDLLAAGSLTESEFLQWMYAMMIAGFETTHTVIGQSTRMYLEDSEVRRLTDQAVDEGRSMRAVEEYIRLISPAMHMARMATTDTEIAGQPIKRDDVMVLYYLAANRDPAVYSEPHRFDPARSETATIPFGSDVHYCIGAHLAKLERGSCSRSCARRDWTRSSTAHRNADGPSSSIS